MVVALVITLGCHLVLLIEHNIVVAVQIDSAIRTSAFLLLSGEEVHIFSFEWELSCFDEFRLNVGGAINIHRRNE